MEYGSENRALYTSCRLADYEEWIILHDDLILSVFAGVETLSYSQM